MKKMKLNGNDSALKHILPWEIPRSKMGSFIKFMKIDFPKITFQNKIQDSLENDNTIDFMVVFI